MSVVNCYRYPLAKRILGMVRRGGGTLRSKYFSQDRNRTQKDARFHGQVGKKAGTEPYDPINHWVHTKFWPPNLLENGFDMSEFII
jgi:hypothetical protein